MDVEELSTGDFKHISGGIREGRPDPEGARQLLGDILKRIKCRNPHNWDLSDAMWEYLSHGLTRFVDGEAKTLDQAFGLHRKNNRPNAPEEIGLRLAIEVENCRHQGMRVAAAIESVAKESHKSYETVQRAHKRYRKDAFIAHCAAQICFNLEVEKSGTAKTNQLVQMKGGKTYSVRVPTNKNRVNK